MRTTGERLVAQELVLSFVPDPEQRLWRTVTPQASVDAAARADAEPTGGALEEAHIKLSSLVSDLLGQRTAYDASARRWETDPAALAAMANKGLRATRRSCATRWAPAASSTCLPAAAEDALEELAFLEQQIGQLDQEVGICSAPMRML